MDVGESIAKLILQHIMGCHIVHCNWKIDNGIMSPCDMNSFVRKARNAFKKNGALEDDKSVNLINADTFAKFVNQAECDVLGVVIKPGVNEYCVVESAVHIKGGGYTKKTGNLGKLSSRYRNVGNVVLKILRDAAMLYNAFGQVKAEFIYMAPFDGDVNIEKGLVKVDKFFKSVNLDFSVKGYLKKECGIYCKSFYDELWSPLQEKISQIVDSSDSVLRTMQLYNELEKNNKV